jgi:xanthine dehydrogenase accessory factor
VTPPLHPTDDIPALALSWHRAGRRVALATVVDTWGSAPRPVGSQLVIDGDAQMQGSVSGGCVEGAVIAEALAAFADGQARLLDYGVSDDDAFAVGLACGGRIRVLLDIVGGSLPVEVLDQLVTARAARRAVALVSDLQGPDRRLVHGGHADRFRADTSGVEPDGATFVAIHNPPLRLIVVGAVHIAQPLVAMARMAGHDPVIIDPRPVFGSDSRFPGERIIDDWPDAALAALKPDARTAIVTLTHDAKLDDPAIIGALGSDCYYLGCLGSTRTHAKRVDRLTAAGFGADAIARINAPVGMNIGAKSPGEIAVSILAQITETLRRG